MFSLTCVSPSVIYISQCYKENATPLTFKYINCCKYNYIMKKALKQTYAHLKRSQSKVHMQVH
jgi:hypothetical protein